MIEAIRVFRFFLQKKPTHRQQRNELDSGPRAIKVPTVAGFHCSHVWFSRALEGFLFNWWLYKQSQEHAGTSTDDHKIWYIDVLHQKLLLSLPLKWFCSCTEREKHKKRQYLSSYTQCMLAITHLWPHLWTSVLFLTRISAYRQKSIYKLEFR